MMKIKGTIEKALVVAAATGLAPRIAPALLLAALGGYALPVLADSSTVVKKAQTVTIKAGWNAFSLNVTPEETADEIFKDWPVDSVGYYDPSAFLETKQYSGSGSTEGASRIGYKMWRRGEEALSTIQYLASGVYVCFSTNAAGTSVQKTLYGVPSAPSITWHPSSTNDAMNLVGFSLEGDKKTTLAKYFDGFDGKGATWKAFKVGGGDPSKMSLTGVGGSTEFSDGEALVMTCSKVSDWSGVFKVTPRGGLDFGSSESVLTLTIKNGSTVGRTFSMAFGGGSIEGTTPAPQMPVGLMVRDTSHHTNSWVQFSSSLPFTKTLATNETVEIQVAVDRTKLTGVAGTYYAGVITVTDVSQTSGFKACVPLEVTSDGGTASEHAWPKGMWLASATLDTVTYLKKSTGGLFESEDVKAGGKMKVRLPLYVDGQGKMTLLQRFVYGSDTNGVTHVYSPEKEAAFPVAIGNVKRVSSAVLPIDDPVIAATNGAFGTQAKFAFAVSEKSTVNPYRHPFHPSHDGLKWDFETATPSGDNVTNYVSTVKPEMFSVGNAITLDWDASTGTTWSPEETLTGNLLWELTGVRHEGTIRMKGTFSMKRISSVTIDR